MTSRDKTTDSRIDEGDFSLASREEIDVVVQAMRDAALLPESSRITYLGLLDPPRGELRAEISHDRRFRAYILDTEGGPTLDVTISAARGEILRSVQVDSSESGEQPIMEEEFSTLR